MNVLLAWKTRAQARRDAEAGIEPDLDRIVTALLGSKPRGAGTFEDALLQEQQGRGETFEAMTEDIEALDSALADHAPRLAYVAIALVSFAAEVGASAAALATMGYDGLERLVLGFALAVGTLIIAGAMTRIEAKARGALARWLARTGTAALYLLVITAAAWVRATSDSEDALSVIDILASAVLLAVATGAPAIASHWSFSRLHAAGDLHKRRAIVARAQRTATRSRDRARSARVRMERETAEWEAEAARVRALYLLELRRAQAKLPPKA